MSERVYFDHNATTPVSKVVQDKVLSWISHYGNPSSIHAEGRAAKALLRDSRDIIAQFLNCHPLELIFTSGGSEANNLAIKGVFARSEEKNPLFVSTGIEHPSVLKPIEFIRKKGARFVTLATTDLGIDWDQYEKLLKEKPALVSVMAANNETGLLLPIQKMSQMARDKGVLFHTDAVQMLGKAPVDLKLWDVDFASFSGHKFYSLKGAGILFVRKGLTIESLIHGGGQERHRRAGTENALAIASIAENMRHDRGLVEQTELGLMRDEFEREILKSLDGVSVTSKGGARLSNTSHMVIDGIDGETLLMSLDLAGFSVSTGAACSSGNPEPSPALRAMGLTLKQAQSSLRVSFGRTTRKEDVGRFASVLIKEVHRLRSFGKVV